MTIEDEYRAAEAHIDGWDGYVALRRDEPATGGWGETIAMLFGIAAFAVLCFCGGLAVAAVWSAYDDVPARGVMDPAR